MAVCKCWGATWPFWIQPGSLPSLTFVGRRRQTPFLLWGVSVRIAVWFKHRQNGIIPRHALFFRWVSSSPRRLIPNFRIQTDNFHTVSQIYISRHLEIIFTLISLKSSNLLLPPASCFSFLTLLPCKQAYHKCPRLPGIATTPLSGTAIPKWLMVTSSISASSSACSGSTMGIHPKMEITILESRWVSLSFPHFYTYITANVWVWNIA